MPKYKANDRNWWEVYISDNPYSFTVDSVPTQCWNYTITRERAVVHAGKIDRHADTGKPTVSECLVHFMGYISGVCFGLVEQGYGDIKP
jgi:hypothetical protein